MAKVTIVQAVEELGARPWASNDDPAVFHAEWFWTVLDDDQREEVRDWLGEHGYNLRTTLPENPCVMEVEVRPEAPMLVRRWPPGPEVFTDEVPMVALPPIFMRERLWRP